MSGDQDAETPREHHCSKCPGPNPYYEFPWTSAFKMHELAVARHGLFVEVARELRLEAVARFVTRLLRPGWFGGRQ